MSDIKKINLKKENLFAKQEPTLFGRILPFLLIASFALFSFYSTARNISANLLSYFDTAKSLIVIGEVLFIGLIQYFVYLLILWIYKSFLRTKPYFVLTGERNFEEVFGLCYVVRNLIIGAFGLLQFYYPYLEYFMPIFSLLISYLAITCTYLLLSKKIDIMFRHMYYNVLMLPWFVWHAITAIFAIIFGGAIL